MLYALVWSGRIPDLHVPEGYFGALELAFLCAGIMWVAIFFGRLLFYPFHVANKNRKHNRDRIARIEELVLKHEASAFNIDNDKLIVDFSEGFFEIHKPNQMLFLVKIRNPGNQTILRNWRLSAKLENFHFADHNPKVSPADILRGEQHHIQQGSELKFQVAIITDGDAYKILGRKGMEFTIFVDDVRGRTSQAKWSTVFYETRI